MNQILAIDIGTTKICAVIADIQNGQIQVMGVGKQKAEGIRKGMVINIDQASRSVREAINIASMTSNININRAIVSVSNAYTSSINARGVLSIPANEEITIDKINKVIQNAIHDAAIPSDSEKIQVLPYCFKLDDVVIEDPINMSGQKLEVFVRIIKASRVSFGNLKKVIKNAGVDIENIILGCYASSLAVLNEDEKEIGVTCIDMGGTCDMMIYSGNSMQYDYHLSVGSVNVKVDLASALNTNMETAEKITKDFVDLIRSSDDDTEVIEVPNLSGTNTEMSYRDINEIAKSRVVETLSILARNLDASGLTQNIGAGVVLTGGMVKTKGMLELAKAVFASKSVRIGLPKVLPGLSEDLRGSDSATVVGLLLYGTGKYTNYEMDSNEKIRYKKLVNRQQDDRESAAAIDLSELEISSRQEGAKEEVYDKETLIEKFLKWLKQLF